MSSVFLSFLNYRMRGLLVGFHFCPVLLSGVALFLVAFEANSSIKYFNDNDETVLQGETQYKHAE